MSSPFIGAAFQHDAFQNNAFQVGIIEPSTGAGGGGGGSHLVEEGHSKFFIHGHGLHPSTAKYLDEIFDNVNLDNSLRLQLKAAKEISQNNIKILMLIMAEA